MLKRYDKQKIEKMLACLGLKGLEK